MCEKYKKRPRAFLSYFSHNQQWTKYITKVLEDIGDKIKVATYEKEHWPRLDLSFFDKCGDDWGEWALEVGIEHENDIKTCCKEIQKLLLLNCGLKVLITYYGKDRNEIERIMKEFKSNYASRKYHTENDLWLFIFGPSYSIQDGAPFIVYQYKNNELSIIAEKGLDLKH
jgi:hypothetical protein